MTLSLLADIGGTNTRVALADGARVLPESVARFANAEYQARGQDIGDILADYLKTSGETVSGVCVAAAGPVQDGVAQMTNLHWVIDAAKLRAATGAARTAILNDLQAQGQALGHIAPEKLRPVTQGPKAPGAMLVVGLGTGVNAAPVHGSGAARIVPPSECGHVNMPVRCDEDLALMRFVQDRLAARGEVAHCGVEEVLSGRGLVTLHAFAAAQARVAAASSSAEVFDALEAGDPTATHAARLYTRILAQTLADLALIHLPYAGIYLIGGMARAMTPYFEPLGLTGAFRETRRVDLLENDFSITVVEDDFAALTGCAAFLQAQSG
ncbi:ROK family protein [Pseudotabrizicola formosa]|uniref:glucokinase n=1 Tax=Pseudotabrizicola formosa TaxID=2030009 RepID=UPI000CD0FB78|nr:ROK family protein [Pseudotabrizicola formosa]